MELEWSAATSCPSQDFTGCLPHILVLLLRKCWGLLPLLGVTRVYLHYAMGLMPLHNTNHSNEQLCKAANKMTDLFYQVVTAHQSSPETMAFMAILKK